MKVVLGVLGLFCGTLVGIALGCFAAAALGYWSQATSPNDPTAGSVSIVVIFTVPFGALNGAVLGALIAIRRPRLFYATLVPAAVVLIGVMITYSTLRSMDRPRDFVLEVSGTPGAEYVGLTKVEGKVEKLKGTLPAKFQYNTFRVEIAVALVDPDEQKQIYIDTSANNSKLATQSPTETGIHLILKPYGYSETFGGTSSTWARMSEEEVQALIKNGTIPSGSWEP